MQFRSQVEHLSEKGYGIVRDEAGLRYFVRAVWPGDRGLFEALDNDPGFARLLDLEAAAEERQNVTCPHWGLAAHECFGCPWMHADYEAQLRRKEHRVRHALGRVNLKDIPLEGIWPAPSTKAYRSRAQFKTDGKILGYSGLHGKQIAPISTCEILTPKMQEHMQNLLARLPNSSWEPEPPHIWNYIDIDEESEDFPLNRRRPFQQVHKFQNERMRAWLKDKLQELDRSQKILELFAGSGNFTEVVSSSGFQHILALEVGAEAVARLQDRKLAGVTAQRADLYKPAIFRLLEKTAADSSVLILNPPRAGLMILHRLPRILTKLQHIFYISCDPGTLAGDLRRFTDQGFHIRSIQALDQMPHTPHVECLVALDRQ